MAIYFEKTNEEQCPITGLTHGDYNDQMSFYADKPADIDTLPGLEKLRGGSTCFVMSTKQGYMLGENGWVTI